MQGLYISFFCALIAFTSCNSSTNTSSSQSAAKAPAAPVQSSLHGDGTHLLMNVVNQYYGLKNALVAGKAPRTDSAAILLGTAADTLTGNLKNDTSIAFTDLKPYLDSISQFSKAIHNITDPTCERQRIDFAAISSAMYALLKKVDIKNAGIYHEHCPMALNEKGAYWLSDESEIKNPYFGKKMLECGDVEDSLK